MSDGSSVRFTGTNIKDLRLYIGTLEAQLCPRRPITFNFSGGNRTPERW